MGDIVSEKLCVIGYEGLRVTYENLPTMVRML